MVLAVATPNPIGIYKLDEFVSLAFQNVLSLPLEREVQTERSPSPEEDTNGKEEDADWHKSFDVDHINDERFKERILDILAKHGHMWLSGRLGTTTATEHRMELEPCTRPIR